MSIDNLSSLLAQLETILTSDVLSESEKIPDFDSTSIVSLLDNFKEELKLRVKQSKAENSLRTDGDRPRLETQQLIYSLLSELPMAIAIVDRQMRYLGASDRWLKDYQLVKSDIIERTLYESLPGIPTAWQQGHQNCLAGRVQSLQQSQNEFNWDIFVWRDAQEQILGLIILSQVNTEEVLLRAKLNSSEAQMRAVFGGMNELVFTVETDSDVILVLPTNFFELYDDDFVNQVIDRTHAQIFNSSEAKNYQALIARVLQTGLVSNFEYDLELNSGRVCFSVNVAPVSQNTAILVARDITQRKEQEQDTLFAEKELAHVTLQSIGDAVITTNNLGQVKYLNPVAEKLTGWQSQAVKGRDLAQILPLISEKTRKPIVNSLQKIVLKNRVCKLTAKNLLIARDGNEYAIEGLASPIKDRQSKLIGAVIVFRDVTKSRRMAQRLSWQATHDPLTNLCNRRKFEAFVAKAINDAVQNESQHALCLLDLDRFKVVNDTCGHAAGDELLRQITKLLKKRIRSSDVFARVGGDEFGVLLHRCPLHVAKKIANQLRQLVEGFRFVWSDKTFRVGVSIGLVAIKSTTENLTSLLSTADAACYAAKARGGNHVYLYHEEDTAIAQQRGEKQWIEKINRALEENSFRLYAQKIIAIDDNFNSSHHEILLRLLDESGNVILPGTFLPAAERYGLMPAIDRWVIDTFFAGYETYCLAHPESSPFNLYTINLSGASINSKDFSEFLHQQFERYSVRPATICFEITETVAIANLDDAIALISWLKDLGCLIALDDFGSGMSSLNYLKNLPIDYLKIDGSFVVNIASDKIDYATVECFNHLSQIMDIKTIAEFVENETILQNLKQIGIDYAQGYGIERPQPLVWS